MKYNLDNLFRNKLNEIQVDYKPEYWDEMKNMLPKKGGGSPIGGGSFSSIISSTFFKSAIFISSFAIIGITGYFLFDQNSIIESPKEISNNLVNKKVNLTKSDPCQDNINSMPIASSKTNNTVIPYKFVPVNLPFTADYFQYLLSLEQTKPNCNQSVYIFNINDIVIDLPEEETTIERDIVLNKADDQISPNLISQKYEPKNIKPMEKPQKDVFKSKKGILYRLGFKK